MLPSRLFRNLGIPPPLRSLLKIHPSLSPSIAVQLRMRLSLSPRLASNNLYHSRRIHSSPIAENANSQEVSSSAPARTDGQPVIEDPPEPRLSLTFTCAVEGCLERSTHEFSKRAYERGIVLVTCPKCKNRSLLS